MIGEDLGSGTLYIHITFTSYTQAFPGSDKYEEPPFLVKGAISVMLWLSQMSAAQSAAQQTLFFNNFNTVSDAAAWLGLFFVRCAATA